MCYRGREGKGVEKERDKKIKRQRKVREIEEEKRRGKRGEIDRGLKLPQCSWPPQINLFIPLLSPSPQLDGLNEKNLPLSPGIQCLEFSLSPPLSINSPTPKINFSLFTSTTIQKAVSQCYHYQDVRRSNRSCGQQKKD